MSFIRHVAVMVVLLAGVGVSHANAADEPAPSLHLPDGVRPERYAVTLSVVPGEAKVQGRIVVDITVDRPQSLIWLHADRIAIGTVDVDGGVSRATLRTQHQQVVGLAFDPPLESGPHRVTLDYEANQDLKSTRGIFAVRDAAGWYAMTQFEALSARRAFPCFDEPRFKVPWQLTLRVPRDLTAVSNAPIAEERVIANGMKEIAFAPTKPLPSYLVAFAVGPFDVLDAGRVGETPIRIVAPRRHTADLAFARRALPELLAKEAAWFAVPFPYAKLDHAAIPLTVRFAMENAGLITYGAPILIAPGATPAPFRHGLANVGAHEMAHQWFGNLVTMRDWDDLWLNEAFANWLAQKMVDAWDPSY
ncbi:MAG TPA: M1 family metallopeptidase, partial [Casimicrobiaceae bacterium]|nr:M1 family metallopeptidase [Casimicrobiaceae bacterium]